MPVRFHKSGTRCYAQWGSRGAKYYYKCSSTTAKARAKKKADAQARAAYVSGYKG